jgi:proteasome lid subunit RPN8/RPN11
MLWVERPIYNMLLTEAEAGYPLEVCGLLAGSNGRISHIYPIYNKLQSPVAFEMEPLQQIQTMIMIEENGEEIMGMYHSHPTGPERPSATDIAQAYYPDVIQFIVSLRQRTTPSVQAFLIADGQIQPVPFLVIE